MKLARLGMQLDMMVSSQQIDAASDNSEQLTISIKLAEHTLVESEVDGGHFHKARAS